VWVFDVSSPALVLGSTQALDVVDLDAAAAAGVEVVRRRSGGGAVLLVPGEALWVDVVVPRGDALWDDDVGRSTQWLGTVWAAALSACGVVGAVQHTGPMVHTTWSRVVCFAGIGPGEVLVDGRKAVGISQRRTRAGARFQCVSHRRWPGEELVALLAPPRPTPGDLPPVAELSVVGEPLLTAFLAAL
jgi:lipoate---protein ligase